MHKIVLIFFYFLVAEWQSLAVRRFNTDAERAIVELTTEDRNRWLHELATEDLAFTCYELMLNYEKIEKFLKDKHHFPINITSKYVADVKKEVMILECTSTEDYNYWFTAGVNLTYVRIRKDTIDGKVKYIPDQFIDPWPVDEWEYIHFKDDVPAETMAFCEKIFAEHHPRQRYRVVHALRAIRCGVDENFKPRMFMTLLCYYDWNNYIEYCEGKNDNEIFQVVYSGGGKYMPMLNLPIHVEYRF